MSFKGVTELVSLKEAFYSALKFLASKSKKFGRDSRGATIIEFAMIAAPLIALLLATFETTLTLFTQQILETSAEKAARKILTGTAQASNMTRSQFKSQVCASFPSYMKCNDVIVDVRVASSISTADAGAPTLTYDGSGNLTNAWLYNMGGSGDVVVIKTMYLMDQVAGPLGFNLANTLGNKRLLVSTYVFRNEG